MSKITFDYVRDTETGLGPVTNGRIPCHLLALGGTAPEGTEVPIYINGKLAGMAEADASGHWEYTYQPMAGQNYVSAEGSHTSHLLNVEPPTSPVLVLVSDAHNGDLLASGDSIAAHPLNIVGSAAPFSQVEIYDNGKLVDTVTANANGNWLSYLKTAGHHELSLSADGPSLFSVDTAAPPAPAVTHVVDDAGTVIDNGGSLYSYYHFTLHFTGVGEPHTAYTLYDNGKPFDQVFTDGDGRWESYALPDLGHHSFTLGPDGVAFEFTIGDEAPIVDPVDPVNPGDPDPSQPVEITFDGILDNNYDQPPHYVEPGGTTSNWFPKFVGTAPAGAPEGTTVHIIDRVSGLSIGTGVVDASGHWQAQAFRTLDDGHYELYATAYGAESNTFSFDVAHDATVPVEPVPPVDPSEPMVTIDGLRDNNHDEDPHYVADGGTTGNNLPWLFGTATPGAEVNVIDRITGQTWYVVRADANGHWEDFPTNDFPDGHYELYAMIFGAESGTFSFDVTHDVTVPVEPVPPVDPVVITLDGVLDNKYNEEPHYVEEGGTTSNWFPKFVGTAPEGTTVHIIDRVSGTWIAVGTADANGHWEAQPSRALSDGHYELYATASGGVESGTFSFDVSRDATVPGDPANPGDPSNPDPGNPDPTNPDPSNPDPTNPDPAAITIDGLRDNRAGEDPHYVDAGGTTDNKMPVIVGSAPAGTWIVISDLTTGHEIGTVQADANGHWELAVEYRFANGDHILSAVDTEHQYDFSNEFAFDVDSPVAPVYPTDPIDATHPVSLHVYAMQQDGVPHDVAEGSDVAMYWEPDLFHAEGTAQAGLSFEVSVQSGISTQVSYVTADENGHWSLDLRMRVPGDQTVRIVVDGQEVESFNFHWTPGPADAGTIEPAPVDGTDASDAAYDDGAVQPIDNGDAATAPVVTIDGIRDSYKGEEPHYVSDGGTTDRDFPMIFGTAPAGQMVDIYDLVSGRAIAHAVADENGYWEHQPSRDLPDGHYELVASYGPYATSAPFSFDVDTSHTSPVTDPVAPVDSVVPGDSAEPVAPVNPTDYTLHVYANQNGAAHELVSGETSETWYGSSFHAEGEAPAGTTFKVVEWSGPMTTVHDVTADENGHWSVDLQLYSTGEQTIMIGNDSGVVESFTFNWQYPGSNAVSEQTAEPSLTAADLLVDHDASLFADEAQSHQAPAETAHAALDVSDLGQVLAGGVHADVTAADAARPVLQQEEQQHS